MKAHILEVNDFLSTLSTTECPEGKITRELSRKYPQLAVWLLVMEELQVYYELDSQEQNKEIAALLSYMAVAAPPRAGRAPAAPAAGTVSTSGRRRSPRCCPTSWPSRPRPAPGGHQPHPLRGP